jgi:hypothetical protein
MTISLSLREEHRLRVFENRMLRPTSGKEEEAGETFIIRRFMN